MKWHSLHADTQALSATCGGPHIFVPTPPPFHEPQHPRRPDILICSSNRPQDHSHVNVGGSSTTKVYWHSLLCPSSCAPGRSSALDGARECGLTRFPPHFWQHWHPCCFRRAADRSTRAAVVSPKAFHEVTVRESVMTAVGASERVNAVGSVGGCCCAADAGGYPRGAWLVGAPLHCGAVSVRCSTLHAPATANTHTIITVCSCVSFVDV